MDNKFLKQYPQLWEPKIGDKVVVVRIDPNNPFTFNTGTITSLTGYNTTIIGVSLQSKSIKCDDMLLHVQRYYFKDELELICPINS